MKNLSVNLKKKEKPMSIIFGHQHSANIALLGENDESKKIGNFNGWPVYNADNDEPETYDVSIDGEMTRDEIDNFLKIFAE